MLFKSAKFPRKLMFRELQTVAIYLNFSKREKDTMDKKIER